jgi:hypothetical protein
MAVNFTQALVNARRRASISGRPLSQQETAGIAAGEAATSSERAARLKSLRLQERQLAQQNEQFRKEQEFKEKQAEKEERTAMGSAVGTLVGAGAVVGGAVMGGWGAGVGMAALATPLGWGALAGGALLGGIFGGNTHLCTEASHVLGKIDNRHLRAYQKLRYYAKENLPSCYRFYNDRGSEIIAGIRDAFPEPRQYREWWEEFYDKIIAPMLDLSPEDTVAYYNYAIHVRDVLIPAYAPHQKAEFDELWHKDMMEVS